MKDEIKKEITRSIQTGVYSMDNLLDLFCKDLYPGKIDAEEVKKQVIQSVELIGVAMDEDDWPEETDSDILWDILQINLNQHKVLGLPNAGYTVSDGITAVNEFFDVESYNGYCFYTLQGIEGAIEGDGLHLYFGSLNEEVSAVEVGKLIANELRKEDFQIEWNESIDKSIYIKNIEWLSTLDGTDLIQYFK